jgi:addiction module HigA family antidote
MTDQTTLAALLHELGVGCMEPFALTRDVCVPTDSRYSMHRDLAARLIAAGVRVGDAGLREAAHDWSVAPGEVLREWFTERGITQSEVAARMGVAPPEVSKLVNGHDRITPRMALALERACGINADVLARMQTDHDLHALRAAIAGEPER